jgi:hypothetical protein
MVNNSVENKIKYEKISQKFCFEINSYYQLIYISISSQNFFIIEPKSQMF